MAWPAYALTHGLNPFFSTFANHPGCQHVGEREFHRDRDRARSHHVALRSCSTSTFALTLSPLLSALAMFILVRRWVRWAPAAFVAGLLYRFSPLLLVSLSNVWLMVGMAPVPPLVVLFLDELLFRQRRSPIKVGVGLGVLVFLQFFLGIEMLLIMAISVAIGLVFILIFAAWREKEALKRHWRHAVVGLMSGRPGLPWCSWPTRRGSLWPGPSIYRVRSGEVCQFLQWNTNLRDFFVPAPGDVRGRKSASGRWLPRSLSVQPVHRTRTRIGARARAHHLAEGSETLVVRCRRALHVGHLPRFR